jgi:hypothetical protein
MRGPVEQLGCARRPVKAEVAGSNPVGTARTGPMHLLSPGQVAQSVERAAENRKVGGSIPSLPTTSALVRVPLASTPPGIPTADSGILPALPLTTAATGGPPEHPPAIGVTPTPCRTAAVRLTATSCAATPNAPWSQSGGRRGGRGRRGRDIVPPWLVRQVCALRAAEYTPHREMQGPTSDP